MIEMICFLNGQYDGHFKRNNYRFMFHYKNHYCPNIGLIVSEFEYLLGYGLIVCPYSLGEVSTKRPVLTKRPLDIFFYFRSKRMQCKKSLISAHSLGMETLCNNVSNLFENNNSFYSDFWGEWEFILKQLSI